MKKADHIPFQFSFLVGKINQHNTQPRHEIFILSTICLLKRENRISFFTSRSIALVMTYVSLPSFFWKKYFFEIRRNVNFDGIFKSRFQIHDDLDIIFVANGCLIWGHPDPLYQGRRATSVTFDYMKRRKQMQISKLYVDTFIFNDLKNSESWKPVSKIYTSLQIIDLQV